MGAGSEAIILRLCVGKIETFVTGDKNRTWEGCVKVDRFTSTQRKAVVGEVLPTTDLSIVAYNVAKSTLLV